MKNKLNKFQKSHLIFFFVGIILFLVSLSFAIYFFTSNYFLSFTYKPLKSFAKNIATISEIGFFLALGLFVLRFLIKDLSSRGVSLLNKQLSRFNFEIPTDISNKILGSYPFKKFREILMPFAKFFQRFHIIFALLAGSIILIHGCIFLSLGFKWEIGYIFGILAMVNLFIIIVSGIFRIFNKNILGHKHLGISFIVLMCLHILFI